MATARGRYARPNMGDLTSQAIDDLLAEDTPPVTSGSPRRVGGVMRREASPSIGMDDPRATAPPPLATAPRPNVTADRSGTSDTLTKPSTFGEAAERVLARQSDQGRSMSMSPGASTQPIGGRVRLDTPEATPPPVLDTPTPPLTETPPTTPREIAVPGVGEWDNTLRPAQRPVTPFADTPTDPPEVRAVREWVRTYLGEDVSDAQLAAYMNAAGKGATLDDITALIQGTPEFLRAQVDLQNRGGATAPDGTPPGAVPGGALARYGTGNIPGADTLAWGDRPMPGFNTGEWGTNNRGTNSIKNTFGKIASRYDPRAPNATQQILNDPDFKRFFPEATLVPHPKGDQIDFGDGRPVDVLVNAVEGGSGDSWAFQTQDDLGAVTAAGEFGTGAPPLVPPVDPADAPSGSEMLDRLLAEIEATARGETSPLLNQAIDDQLSGELSPSDGGNLKMALERFLAKARTPEERARVLEVFKSGPLTGNASPGPATKWTPPWPGWPKSPPAGWTPNGAPQTNPGAGASPQDF